MGEFEGTGEGVLCVYQYIVIVSPHTPTHPSPFTLCLSPSVVTTKRGVLCWFVPPPLLSVSLSVCSDNEKGCIVLVCTSPPSLCVSLWGRRERERETQKKWTPTPTIHLPSLSRQRERDTDRHTDNPPT